MALHLEYTHIFRPIHYLLLLLLFAQHPSPSLSFSNPDVLLIGGGTAGCALAARLCTARPDLTFLLLERATPPNVTQAFIRDSPRELWTAWSTSYISEIFPTVSDKWTAYQQHYAITGNTLGGSSAINARQFVIPLRGSVERWGIKGLNTNSARTYFTRAFRTVGFAQQRGSLRQRVSREFVMGGKNAGYPQNDDPFDTESLYSTFESRLAISPTGVNINSCDAYLTPAIRKCENLRLKQGITVSKILLKKTGGKGNEKRRQSHRAVGVEYLLTSEGKTGKPRRIYARKHVISTAGPYGSPKLLQLSGIGSADELTPVGVRQKVNLPVGQHLQARPIYGVPVSYGLPLEPINNSTLLSSDNELARWQRARNGEHGHSAEKGSVYGMSPTPVNGRDGRNAYLALITAFPAPLLDQKVVDMSCFGNTDSFGYVKIRSSNPFEPPTVAFQVLKHPNDVRRVARCLKSVRKIVRNMPKEHGFKVLPPNDKPLSWDAIRKRTMVAGHIVGGCRVGDVLDDEFRVRNVSGLRVVDSSAMSSIPISSGTLASVYMLAEYGADLIANDL